MDSGSLQPSAQFSLPCVKLAGWWSQGCSGRELHAGSSHLEDSFLSHHSVYCEKETMARSYDYTPELICPIVSPVGWGLIGCHSPQVGAPYCWRRTFLCLCRGWGAESPRTRPPPPAHPSQFDGHAGLSGLLLGHRLRAALHVTGADGHRGRQKRERGQAARCMTKLGRGH